MRNKLCKKEWSTAKFALCNKPLNYEKVLKFFIFLASLLRLFCKKRKEKKNEKKVEGFSSQNTKNYERKNYFFMTGNFRWILNEIFMLRFEWKVWVFYVGMRCLINGCGRYLNFWRWVESSLMKHKMRKVLYFLPPHPRRHFVKFFFQNQYFTLRTLILVFKEISFPLFLHLDPFVLLSDFPVFKSFSSIFIRTRKIFHDSLKICLQ